MPSTETESDMAINKVFIAGNLTRDAELRATSNTHTPVLSFTVAVNERRRNQQNGEWEDYPNFIACVLYGNRAGALFHHLTKGLKVSVEGRLRYRTYLKDDEKRSRLDVVVDEIEFISPRAAQQHEMSPDFAQTAGQAYPASTVTPELYDEDREF